MQLVAAFPAFAALVVLGIRRAGVCVAWAGPSRGEDGRERAADKGLEHGERVAEDAEVHLEERPDGGRASPGLSTMART